MTDLNEVILRSYSARFASGVVGAHLHHVAQGLGLDLSQKALGHTEFDVGLEQRGADVLQNLVERVFVEFAITLQAMAGRAETFGNRFEHVRSVSAR